MAPSILKLCVSQGCTTRAVQRYTGTRSGKASAKCRWLSTHCRLWFSQAEPDIPLGHGELPYAFLPLLIILSTLKKNNKLPTRPQSPTHGDKMASKTLVSTTAFTNGWNTLRFSPIVVNNHFYKKNGRTACSGQEFLSLVNQFCKSIDCLAVFHEVKPSEPSLMCPAHDPMLRCVTAHGH